MTQKAPEKEKAPEYIFSEKGVSQVTFMGKTYFAKGRGKTVKCTKDEAGILIAANILKIK